MKILLANKFFFMNGGSERVFFQERNFLLSRGHEVVDFSMQDERNYPSDHASSFVPNIDFHHNGGLLNKIRQGIGFVHSAVAVKKIKDLADREKLDLAHLHNIYHHLTPSIISVLHQRGIKVVLTLHDCKLICPSYLALRGEQICAECRGRYFIKPLLTHCQNSRSQELLLAIEAFWHRWRKTYDCVDHFLAPSWFMADLTKQRVPAHKISVLRNGIDVSGLKSSYADGGYALFLGRLSKEKGIRTLLEAHERAPSSLALKVVGTGPLEKKIQKEYPKACYLGYQTGRKLNDLITSAAFIVVPSECYENCSMVVLEAMALGKPIIGSRIGGIPEQIEDGRTGLLFEMGNVGELADKMMILWSNSPLRKRMGMKAREKLVKEYTLEKHCNDLITIYKKLLLN